MTCVWQPRVKITQTTHHTHHTGRLSAFYLGTDPPSHAVAPAAESKALDYAAMDAEHRELLGKIKSAAGGGAAAAAAAVSLD